MEIVAGESVIGGGSTPGASLPTVLVAVSAKGLSAAQLAARLRAAEPPVIARVEEGRVLLDLRTVFPEEDAAVTAALAALAGGRPVTGRS
jgi:L-seryl-tRNA(Ser) seleniumtransferase